MEKSRRIKPVIENQSRKIGDKVALISEGVGLFVGEHVAVDLVNSRLESVRKFNTQIVGADNLEELEGISFIIAANHVKPSGALDQQSGFSPDAFIIDEAIKKLLGRDPRIIGKSDDGWLYPKPLRSIQGRVFNPFVKGLVRSIGNIPVRRNPGSLNDEFLREVNQEIKNGGILITFPQGNWSEEFDENMPFSGGTAKLAIDNGIPIVPVYIEGASSWEVGQEVRLAFGMPIETNGLKYSPANRDIVTGELRERIMGLRDSIRT